MCLMILVIASLCWLSISEYINCTAFLSCKDDQNITCVQDNTCVIDCAGESSCRGSILTCKDNQLCNIISTDKHSLRSSTINCPSNAQCIINGTQGNSAFRESVINCGVNGSCYFLFNQTNSGISNFHFFSIFNATHSQYVQIEKYGNKGASVDLTSSIYCPDNGHNGSPSCDIICGGAAHSCSYLNIYAIEGFNDVKITNTYSIMYFIEAFIFCGHGIDKYNIECSIDAANPNECETTNSTSDNTCDNYLIPTMSPS